MTQGLRGHEHTTNCPPDCAAEIDVPAFEQIDILVEGDGSEHIQYVQHNAPGNVPDWMMGELAHVLTLAEDGVAFYAQAQALVAEMRAAAAAAMDSSKELPILQAGELAKWARIKREDASKLAALLDGEGEACGHPEEDVLQEPMLPEGTFIRGCLRCGAKARYIPDGADGVWDWGPAYRATAPRAEGVACDTCGDIISAGHKCPRAKCTLARLPVIDDPAITEALAFANGEPPPADAAEACKCGRALDPCDDADPDERDACRGHCPTCGMTDICTCPTRTALDPNDYVIAESQPADNADKIEAARNSPEYHAEMAELHKEAADGYREALERIAALTARGTVRDKTEVEIHEVARTALAAAKGEQA